MAVIKSFNVNKNLVSQEQGLYSSLVAPIYNQREAFPPHLRENDVLQKSVLKPLRGKWFCSQANIKSIRFVMVCAESMTNSHGSAQLPAHACSEIQGHNHYPAYTENERHSVNNILHYGLAFFLNNFPLK